MSEATATATTLPPKRKRGNKDAAAKPPTAAVDQQLTDIGLPPELSSGGTAPADDLVPAGEAPVEAGGEAVGPSVEVIEEAPARHIADAGADDPMNPFRREAMPAPQPTRTQQREARVENRESKAKQTQTPSKKRFGILGEKIPGAEHIKVHKRLDNGQLAYVGEYGVNDLSQSQNVEQFLNRYIKPSYGPGEYQITGVNAAGQEFDGGIVQLLNPLSNPDVPPPSSAAQSPLALIQQMLDQDARRRDTEMRMLMGQQKDPIQSLKELMELKDTLSPPMPPLKPSEGGSSTTNTMLAGMMQMMGTVLTVALQPKGPDPIMMALLAKLLDDKGHHPPAVDPTQQLVTLSEVVKNLNGSNGNAGDNRLVELLLRERMSPADVLGLVNQVKGERGTDDLKKSMENIGLLLQAVNQLRAQTEPGTGSGFWEAITAMLGNRDLASAVGSRIRSQPPMQQQPQQLPPQPPPRSLPPNDPLNMKARELAARELRLRELEIAKREQALGIVTPAPAQTQSQPPPAAPAAQAEAAAAAPAAEAEQQQQQATLPRNIAEYVNNYIEANGDQAAIVENTLNMLSSFRDDPQWKPYAEVIFQYILQSDRAKFLQYMASFFVSLRTINMIEDGLARQIMDALQNNFDAIVETVQQGGSDEGQGEEGDEDETEEGDDDGEEEGEDVLGIEREDE